MEQLKKNRAVLRATFTKQFNTLCQYLNETKHIEARATLGNIEHLFKKISDLDEQIMSLKIDDVTISEEDLEKESSATYDYRNKYEMAKVKIQDLTLHNVVPEPNLLERQAFNPTGVVRVPNYNLRLPKVEMRKFSGEVKEWLPFWNQYQRIHEDDGIPPIDKFYYLDQAIVHSSRAWHVLESFPPTEENYPLAINALKERFGREDVLIEVYIRELLSLTLPSNKSGSLTEMYDKLECRLRALEVLGVTKGKCAAILCPLLESCMDEDFLRVWQRSYSSQDVLTAENRLEKFMEFMKGEVQNEERINVAMSGFVGTSKNPKISTCKGTYCHPKPNRVQSVPTATGLMTLHDEKKSACIFCGDTRHKSADCYKARKMSLSECIEIVKSNRCCLICLKSNHMAKNCKYKQRCALCDKRHVILLCSNLKRNVNTDKVSEIKVTGIDPGQENTLANVTSDGVFLPTLMVKLRGDGVQKNARAILDTGSQRSYILKSTAQEMQYTPLEQENIIHSLFGGSKTGICQHNKYKVRISSTDDKYACNFDVLDQNVICENVPNIKEGPWTQELLKYGVTLKDNFGPIEVLIGADVAGRLMTGNIRQINCSVSLMETNLGWTILGKVPSHPINQSTAMLVTSMFVKELNISNLWKLDLIGITDPTETKSQLERLQETDRFFQDTLKIDSEGRYEVKLPWKDGHPELPTNRVMALRRLQSTINKLEKDGIYKEYDGVFKEWMKDGVIEQVSVTEAGNTGHYLPHRHVVKENSTTRVRPVFDASAHEVKQPSLNDCLEKGCNLIEQIPSLLLRFRLKEVGVVADIKRAFLQISICPDDRDVLRFFWKDNLGNTVIYRHKRVVFGVICSPYQLNAVIKHHLNKELNKSKEGNSVFSNEVIHTLLNCFYVDNLVTSVDNQGQLESLITEAKSLMAEGKFDLRGWEYTNPDEEYSTSKTNVLGMIWNRKDDTLSVNCDTIKRLPDVISKRTILSISHSVFDPIGFTCPVVLEPKLILRELWSTDCGWDDKVSEYISNRFIKWMEKLSCLSDLKVTRWLLNFSIPDKKWSVHTFCDASEDAYAAVVFLRVESNEGVSVQLIQAKTRVAPIKNITIPRLELLAALIGARLYSSVIDSLPEQCFESYFWSDSTTVLAWIHRDEQWAPFVRNRVIEIRRLTQSNQWHHVPGVSNPADLPSRGCSAEQLIFSRWWEGPKWLKNKESFWPDHNLEFDEQSICKEKLKGVTTMLCSSEECCSKDWYYKYFSNYEKNIRMMAWLQRFVDNTSSNSHNYVRRIGQLTVGEIKKAESIVIKLIQKSEFKTINDPRISGLQPFEDSDGLIRLKTKISNRPDSYDFRYPVILPKDHPLVRRLIFDMHVKNCHVKSQGLLSILRENFWILGGRKTIRSVISQCMRCKRHEVKHLETISPPLPLERVRDAGVFEITGVDLAGPVYLKDGKKSWICLFTCGVFRAVHLELLMSVSTEDFLLALRRFIARRGRPAVIFSDNGTNFVGADNSLRKVDWEKVHEYCTLDRIKWKFNPPSAPWWGGFFERMIGLMKKVLRRILGKSSLNYCEMETILCDCESVMNARPLTYVADSTNELVPITPAMFIQDIREVGVPDLDEIESTSIEKRLKYRKKLRDDLRRRFRSEYLGQLRQEAARRHTDVNVGDIVLIENDGLKRVDWPLGRVIELLRGKDGVVRLVRLKLGNGAIMLRPIQRLFLLLELQQKEEPLIKSRYGRVIRKTR